MRKTYVIREGKLAPKHEVRSSAHNVIGDIEPYESVITGERIGGRRQHKDHLRDHSCIEVGNEKSTFMGNNNGRE